MKLERDIESYLTKSVKKLGGLCFKFTSPGNAGVPDRIVILNGVHFVELKRPSGGVLSSAQKVMHKRFNNAGERVHVLKNRKEVDEFVRDIYTARLPETSDRVGNRA